MTFTTRFQFQSSPKGAKRETESTYGCGLFWIDSGYEVRESPDATAGFSLKDGNRTHFAPEFLTRANGNRYGFVIEMSDIPADIAVSCGEAASILGLSEQRVRALFRQGALKGRQIGKQWITSPENLRQFRENGAKEHVVDRPRLHGDIPSVKALSFFSGAMGLDLGLEQAGIHILLTCEVDRYCRQTITANRPDVAMIGDIWGYSSEQIVTLAGLSAFRDVDVMVGGPPCQAFSTAGSRKGFNDARGNAFLRYVDLILEIKPRFAVIENVRGLLSAPMLHTPHAERGKDWIPDREELPGGALFHVLQLLRSGGYKISFNLYNAANFGVPQSRERVVLMCTLDDEKLPHLMPTHSRHGEFGLPEWLTLRQAFAGLDQLPCDHAEFPEERLRFYRMLKPGQYWKHLPPELHREALGASLDAGGGKTGFYRRLDWDKPSCTLVTSPTMPATDICHPTEDRPISIQEYMRIQQFPDDWEVCGSLTEQYRQVGNAVPVGLGRAVGECIMARIEGRDSIPPVGFPYSRYKETDELSWEEATNLRLNGGHKESARSKRARTSCQESFDFGVA